jgi:NAD(P)-dependent dehydrogenase (short-subunit alcohol dehydrogenase family)
VAASHTALVNPPAEIAWFVDPLASVVRKPTRTMGFTAIQADLMDPDAIARVVDVALADFGRVDLLVNAAAVPHLAPLLSERFMLTSHMVEELSAIGVRVNSVAPDSFPGGITTESVCDASRASIATR